MRVTEASQAVDHSHAPILLARAGLLRLGCFPGFQLTRRVNSACPKGVERWLWFNYSSDGLEKGVDLLNRAGRTRLSTPRHANTVHCSFSSGSVISTTKCAACVAKIMMDMNANQPTIVSYPCQCTDTAGIRCNSDVSKWLKSSPDSPSVVSLGNERV